MSLPIIGTIYNSLRTAQLGIKWQQRKQNPFMRKDGEEDPQVKRLREDAEQVRKSNILSSLTGKLKAGGELTDEELQYLRENNPEMYKEAVAIKQEREAYKKQLRNCRTKDEVEELKTRKLQEFVQQANVIMGNANIPRGAKQGLMEKVLMRVMGIQKEHIRFTKTQAYNSLKWEKEIADEEKAEEERKAENEKALEEDAPAAEPEQTEPDGTEPSEESGLEFEDVQKELEGFLEPEGTVSEAKPVSVPAVTGPAKLYTAKGDAAPLDAEPRAGRKVKTKA